MSGTPQPTGSTPPVPPDWPEEFAILVLRAAQRPDAVRRLADQAVTADDPDVREVAAYFARLIDAMRGGLPTEDYPLPPASWSATPPPA